jgi:hypothetical protein
MGSIITDGEVMVPLCGGIVAGVCASLWSQFVMTRRIVRQVVGELRGKDPRVCPVCASWLLPFPTTARDAMVLHKRLCAEEYHDGC